MRDLGQIAIRQMIRPMFGRDPRDIHGIRRGLKTEIEAEVARGKLPAPMIRLLNPAEELALDLSHVVGVEPDELAAALLHHHGRQPGVLRSFRNGVETVRLRGAACRAVAILELLPGSGDEPDRWWLSRRVLGQHSDQLTFVGSWEDTEGQGMEQLDQPFRRWIQTGHNGRLSANIHKAITTPAPPQVQVCVRDLPGPPPQDARTAAEWVGVMIRADALAGRFGDVRAMIFRDTVVEDYRIQTLSGFTLDDLIRNAASGGKVSAVALVRPAEGKDRDDGSTRKAIAVMAECDGRRWGCVWHLVPRDQGQIDVPLVYEEDQGRPGPCGWIGVEPTVRFRLKPLAVNDEEA